MYIVFALYTIIKNVFKHCMYMNKILTITLDLKTRVMKMKVE